MEEIVGAGLTVIVTSMLLETALSDAVSRKTYEPNVEKLAVVLKAFALANVTVPGPLTFVHVVVNTLPAGKPSSVAVPPIRCAGSRSFPRCR